MRCMMSSFLRPRSGGMPEQSFMFRPEAVTFLRPRSGGMPEPGHRACAEFQAFTWCRDEASGIARAWRKGREFGHNVTAVWAEAV